MRKVFWMLNLELTRRCNMHCAHCMRGEGQNKDMSFEVIDKALEGIAGFALCLTGGEPSLNVPAIRHISKVIKERGLNLDHIVVVTNGKEVSYEFIAALEELLALTTCGTGVDDWNYIAISGDKFHEPIPEENREKLSKLRGYHPDGNKFDFEHEPMLDSGRAKRLNGEKIPFAAKGRIAVRYAPDDDILYFDEDMSVTVDGDVVNASDYSWDNPPVVGSVFDPEWAEKLKREACGQ